MSTSTTSSLSNIASVPTHVHTYEACDSAPAVMPKPPSKLRQLATNATVSSRSSASSRPRSESADTAQYEKRESDSDQASARNEPVVGFCRERMTGRRGRVAREEGGRRAGAGEQSAAAWYGVTR